MSMSRDAIRFCIKRKELYESPGLNERLYLHNKGFTEIRNLEPFTEVTSLFLEGNELAKIDGLSAQKQLQSLYLQKNKIVKIGEGLDHCLQLKYLDVSNNLISKIDNLSSLPSLESLIIKGNQLSKPDSIRHIVHMKRLRELDMSKNKINCTPESIIEILSQCKSLRIVSLKGNPITKSTKHYRKLVVSRCKKLTHLDGRPICGEERRRCKVWGDVVKSGGSYDEADAAAFKELNQIKAEQCEQNALRRSLHGSRGSDDGSTCSGKSNTLGASVVETFKRTMGLVDSRAPSSNISVSSKRMSSIGESMKRELEEVRGIVESQRKEIVSLKEQLQEKSKENVQPAAVDMLDMSVTDSERETPYSIVQNQQLAQKVAAPLQGVQATNNRSSSMASIGTDFDPFSVMPPVPPRNTFS